MQGESVEMLVQIHLLSWDETTIYLFWVVGWRKELNDNSVTVVYGILNLI